MFIWMLLVLLLVRLCSVKSWWPFPGARYQVLLIPDCPGALNDLAHSGSLHRILTHFISHQSKCETNFRSSKYVLYSIYIYVWCRDLFVSVRAEPVCAVGEGVSALCCATEGQKWIFSGYSLTGVSLPQVTMKKIYLNVSMCSVHLITSVCCCCWQPSVFELVRRPDFANLPLVVEDFVKDSGGSYTGKLSKQRCSFSKCFIITFKT